MIFQPAQLSAQELLVIDKITILRSQLRFPAIAPLRWYGMLRRNTLARAIQGSNSIEGFNVTQEDAIAAVEGEEPLDASDESWQAVVGYRNAMTYVLQLTQDPSFRFNEGYLRSLHFMMVQYDLTKHPGNWRRGPIYVRDELRNRVVYEAPDRHFVETLMEELIAELNQKSTNPQAPDLVKAAMAHLNLVMIHPFADGNGRMARCLQTMVLSRQGILGPEFLSVEEYLGRFTQDYYEVLAQVGQGSWRPQNDTRPWLRFMLKAHYQQAALLVYRMKRLQRLWDEIEIIVLKAGLPDRLIPALADAAQGNRVRNAIYRKQADVSENLASRDLKMAVGAKFLSPEGDGRGRYYVPSSTLKELRNSLSEEFSVDDPFEGAGAAPRA